MQIWSKLTWDYILEQTTEYFRNGLSSWHSVWHEIEMSLGRFPLVAIIEIFCIGMYWYVFLYPNKYIRLHSSTFNTYNTYRYLPYIPYMPIRTIQAIQATHADTIKYISYIPIHTIHTNRYILQQTSEYFRNGLSSCHSVWHEIEMSLGRFPLVAIIEIFCIGMYWHVLVCIFIS